MKASNSLASSTFPGQSNLHLSPIPKHFIPKKDTLDPLSSGSSFPHPLPLMITSPLHLWLHPVYTARVKGNHTIRDLLCLPPFAQHNVLEVCPHCSVDPNITPSMGEDFSRVWVDHTQFVCPPADAQWGELSWGEPGHPSSKCPPWASTSARAWVEGCRHAGRFQESRGRECS